MKIYIMGPSGSGKTTLAGSLSKKYNIKSYELDCIVYDDENNHIKRSNEKITNLFNKILKEDSWIIEDVGREIFNEGLEHSDIIYYLRVSKPIVYKRVIIRWFKQRFGKEKYNYPPTLYQFLDMIRIAHDYFKKENSKLEKLIKYKNKVIYLTNKDLKCIKKKN